MSEELLEPFLGMNLSYVLRLCRPVCKASCRTELSEMTLNYATAGELTLKDLIISVDEESAFLREHGVLRHTTQIEMSKDPFWNQPRIVHATDCPFHTSLMGYYTHVEIWLDGEWHRIAMERFARPVKSHWWICDLCRKSCLSVSADLSALASSSDPLVKRAL